MTDLRRPPSSSDAPADADARLSPARGTVRGTVRTAAEDAARDLAGPPADPFPGDTHWYDLPDDDAAPEDDDGEAGARWRPWRLLRRR